MSANHKADAAWEDYVSQQQEEKIEELERELKAANAKIKRLEDENDAMRADLLLWNEQEVKP